MDSKQIMLINEIDQLNEIAFVKRNTSPEVAKPLAEEARDKAEAIGYSLGVGRAIRTLASIACFKSPPLALTLATEALEILLAEGDLYHACTAYLPIHIYFFVGKQYALSEDTLNQCVRMATETGNISALALAEYNLGYLCCEVGRFDEVEEHYSRAIEFAQQSNNQRALWITLSERLRFRAIAGNHPFIESDLEDLVAQAEEEGSAMEIAEMLHGIARFATLAGTRFERIRWWRRARTYVRSQGFFHKYAVILDEQANYYRTFGRRTSTARKLNAAIVVASLHGFTVQEANMLGKSADDEYQAGNFGLSAARLLRERELRAELNTDHSETKLHALHADQQVSRFRRRAAAANARSEELARLNEELRVAIEQQAVLQKELMRLASTDDLTGAINRRQIMNEGLLEMERHRHTGAPFCVSIIDIDHFKSINDTFGHATGDEILRRLTKSCQALLRKFDVFGRLGGEEFCIIHHDSDLSGATMAVKRVMKAIECLFVADILPDREFSVSVGIAQVHNDDSTFYDVLHQADLALYEAKRSGRNTYRTTQSRLLEAA